MKKKNKIQFVESLILLPIMTMLMPLGGLPTQSGLQSSNLNIAPTPIIVSLQKENIEAKESAREIISLLDKKALNKSRAEAIDAYFKYRRMPLAGTGMKMVLEAEKNNLDWRLLPAIAVRESTGGKNACLKAKYNSFGWGSCKISFNSNEHAIEVVAKNLGGNNPNTAKHYGNKNTKEIIDAYNPPHIIPKYADQVLSIMDAIEDN